MSEDEVLYVCLRVADMPIPYVPCLKGKCRVCKQEVYYSKYVYENDLNVKRVIDAGKLLCTDCAMETLKEEDITAPQSAISEARDYLQREKPNDGVV